MKKFKVLFILSLMVNFLFIGVGSFGVYKQGGMDFVNNLLSAKKYPNYYLHKKKLFESFDYTEDVDKVFLGDSITDYGEFNEYFPGEMVLNRGIVEDGTKGVLNRIDEVVSRNPQEVYILIGINDINKKVDAEVYQKNMEKIIQSFDQTSTQVVVQSILPINNKDYSITISNKTVDQFNKVLQLLAKENGIKYIDLNRHFEDEDGQLKKEFTVDGVHLTTEGYEVWMDNLYY